MMTKKAMSAIIATMVLILIVLVATGIIWTVLNKTVEEGLEGAKSCYDLLGEVTVNSQYTCYNSINDEMNISIEVGDVNIDGLLIVIAHETSTVDFELTDEFIDVENLRYYNGTVLVKVPGKNAGSTYIASDILEAPLSIQIAPKINDELCEGDSFTNIGFCSRS